MTIARGQPWGREVDRPDDLVAAHDDAELARLLAAIAHDRSAPAAAAAAGDVARTLGSRDLAGRSRLTELPFDLLDVRLDGQRSVPACAHVVIRSPRRRGGWWRGRVVIVMNAEFIGDWDVAPRGHPNDGRVEIFEVDRSFGMRQRLAARRRARTATHVPHPAISTRSVKTAAWSFDRSMAVVVDGVRIGTARSVEVTVLADATTVHA